MKIKKLIKVIRRYHLVKITAIILVLFFCLSVLVFIFPPQKSVEQKKETLAKYQDFHLEIPKLDLQAPVVLDVSGDDKKLYFEALESGVAHLAGTKKPGENGLIFLFGHSSFYPWSPGEYKEVFRHLDKVAVDDEIFIWYENKEYKYRVIETKIVMPNDVSILAPTEDEQLVLMTCWPLYTTQKRLLVIAKPI